MRDPEGLLSDIPALGTTLLGLLTALWLRRVGAQDDQSAWPGRGRGDVPYRGLSLVAFGFPLNKKMWTSSYVSVERQAGRCFVFTLIYWAN